MDSAPPLFYSSANVVVGSGMRNSSLLVYPGKVPQHVLADACKLPRPYRGWHIWLLAGLCALVLASGALLLQWLAYVHDLVLPVLHGIRITGPLLVLAVSVVLFRLLLAQIQRRRRENLRRFIIVAECNHHIRNALQLMSGVSYRHGYAEIAEAVTRIEQTLTEILTKVNDV